MNFALRSFLSAGLLAALTLTAHAKIERVIEKTFDVQPDGLLRVETSGGNIKVDSHASNVVKVVARQKIRANSESEADDLLKKVELTIEQNSSGVVARAKQNRSNWSRNPVQIDFDVTVPTNYRAEIRTSGGNIEVADLAGKVHARTSGGNIVLGKISSDIDAGTSGGDIRLEEGAASVKLDTSGGNIRVGRAVGPTDLDTSGGDIVVNSVENTLRADTSGGNVSATIVGALKGECYLSTSGGNVRATIDQSAAFYLDASTSGGRVDAGGITITLDGGGQGKNKLAGKVNGGGPVLKLRTSGGNIDVKTR